MSAITNSVLQHLVWNPKKNNFKIQNSSDRKILSFLWNSAASKCYFYRGVSLSTHPWSNKGFDSFKPLFLTDIRRAFENLMVDCPVEEYKADIKLFFDNLQQKIADLEIDHKASNEDIYAALQKILTDSFRQLLSQSHLRMSSLPLQELQESEQQYLNVLKESQCHQYAFYLAKEYRALCLLFPPKNSYDAAFILYPKYFIEGLGYSKTEMPSQGDLVLYLGDPKRHGNNCRFKHLGMVAESGKVKSYWLDFSAQFEHNVFQVPDAYGFEVIFFHKTLQQQPNFEKIQSTTNQMSALIIQFNSRHIPFPLSKLGALLFLLDKLKSACAESNSASKRWDWGEIEKNLRAEILPNLKHQLNHTEIIQEFQSWMQEMLQEYF